jgi:DNA-binding FadR family transcriptional regulator
VPPFPEVVLTTSQQLNGGLSGSPPWARRPANLAHAVAAELVARIVHGQHPPGTALPPEPALCSMFAVSRSVVREAVKVLQEKGLVQVRQGSGTTVTDPTRWDMLDKLVLSASIEKDESVDLLDDLVVTRRLLESDMAHLSARAATPQVVEELRGLVERMDEVLPDVAAYAEHDRAFHDVIMRTSGNRIARAVVRSLEDQVVAMARYMGQPHLEQRVQSNAGHRRIFECIAAGDPVAASEAMFEHITGAWLVRRDGPTDPVRLRR